MLTFLAFKGRAQSIGSPRATFDHGRGARRSFNGPEIQLQAILAVLFDLAFRGGVWLGQPRSSRPTRQPELRA